LPVRLALALLELVPVRLALALLELVPESGAALV